jgi:hypothetical protein
MNHAPSMLDQMLHKKLEMVYSARETTLSPGFMQSSDVVIYEPERNSNLFVKNNDKFRKSQCKKNHLCRK